MKKSYAYIVWFIITLYVVYAFSLNTAAAVFAGAIQSSLHLTNVAVAIATGAFILGFACMQIPAGYLLDKFNSRYVVGSGISLLALGNLITSYADNLLVYTLANFLQGIGAAFAFIAAAVLISQWFAAKMFPIMFGLTQTLACIMAAIIHYYLTVMLTTHTWNSIFRWLAVFGFILLALSFVLIKSPATDKRNTNLSLLTSLKKILSNKQIILCSIAAALSFGVLLAYAGFWYLTVEKFYGTENLQAVMISGLIFFGIGIGTPILGEYSNVIQSRVRVIHVTLCLGTMALLLGLYFPHFATHSLLLTQIIAFFIGFFLSGSMLFYTMVNEISTHATCGMAISVLNMAVFLFNTCMLFMPYIFFTVTATEYFTYLWTLPFCIILAILLLHFIKDTTTAK